MVGSYALHFNGTQFVDLTSAWNGFTQPTNSLSMGGSSFSISLTFMTNLQQEKDQVLLNVGHNPHDCGSMMDVSSRPATERFCNGLLVVAISGGNTVVVQYTAGGYPYNNTRLSGPVTANQWHELRLNYTVVRHGSVGSASSNWKLWLNDKLVDQQSRQSLWHRGIASIALLGRADVDLHGQVGSYFNGSIAALGVFPDTTI